MPRVQRGGRPPGFHETAPEFACEEDTVIRLNPEETARHLPYAKLVQAIARAARETASGVLKAPERLMMPVGEQATLLCMPAAGADIGIVKVVTVHMQNAYRALPAIQGEVIVFDAASGKRLMLLDGPTVTARRTAAVTLLGIDTLAPRPPRSALIIGTGVQAAAHIDALIEYLSIRAFWLAGRDLRQTTTFCERLRSKYPGIDAVPVATSALGPTGVGTDIVVAATTSRTPVIPSQLPDATLAIGVGAFRPDMAELPAELLRRRHIVVDYLPGARHEAGDLLQAGVDWEKVSDLSQLLERRTQNQYAPAVFKSVGHASWDLAAARVAMQPR